MLRTELAEDSGCNFDLPVKKQRCYRISPSNQR